MNDPFKWFFVETGVPYPWEATAGGSSKQSINLGNGNILSFNGDTSTTLLLEVEARATNDLLGPWMWNPFLGRGMKTPPPSRRDEFALASLGAGSALLFGGCLSDGDVTLCTDDNLLSDTWMFSTSGHGSWKQMNGEGPPARRQHVMCSLDTDKVLLHGGFGKGIPPYLFDTWIFDSTSLRWTQITPVDPGPGPRLFPALASLGPGRALMFGGHQLVFEGYPVIKQSTWVFDLSKGKGAWALVKTLNEPLARTLPVMVRATDERVLMYGGKPLLTDCVNGGNVCEKSYVDDIWLFDATSGSWNQTWNDTRQSVGPTSQAFKGDSASFPPHAFTTLPNNDIMLFGGLSTTSAWIYSLSNETWAQLQSYPEKRESHAMCSLGIGNGALLFGGINKENEYLDDVWWFSLDINKEDQEGYTWIRRNSGISARFNHAMSFLSSKKTVVFGGIAKSEYTILVQSDTWIFSDSHAGGTWTELNIKGPPKRQQHAMATLVSGSVLLHGGGAETNSAYAGCLADVWKFEPDTSAGGLWTELKDSSAPPALCGHAMTNLDLTIGKVMLFGGLNVDFQAGKPKQIFFDSTWIFNTSSLSDEQWIEIHTKNKPSARANHAMASFNSHGRTIMYGGVGTPDDHDTCRSDTCVIDSKNYKSDTWYFNAGTTDQSPFWSPIDLFGRPRKQHTMATVVLDSDAIYAKIVCFGGSLVSEVYSSSLTATIGPNNDAFTIGSGSPLGSGGPYSLMCPVGFYSDKLTHDNVPCTRCPNGTTTYKHDGKSINACRKCSDKKTSGTCSVNATHEQVWHCNVGWYGNTCEKTCGGCGPHGVCNTGELGKIDVLVGSCVCTNPYVGSHCNINCDDAFCGATDNNSTVPYPGFCKDPYHTIYENNISIANIWTDKTDLRLRHGNLTCSCPFGWGPVWGTYTRCAFPGQMIAWIVGVMFAISAFVFLLFYRKELHEKIFVQEEKNLLENNYQLFQEETEIEMGQKDQVIHMHEERWRISEKDLQWDTRVAAGGYGEVWKGKWKITGDRDVAIKKMFITAENIDMVMENRVFDDTEINVLMQTGRDQNLVEFFGAGQMSTSHVFLVTEFVSGGDLFHRLSNTEKEFKWNARLSILQDIASGMEFIHNIPMIHRDLKSMNVLLDLKGRAKIADFGLSKFTGKHDSVKIPPAVGDFHGETKSSVLMTYGSFSIPWTAPEVLLRTGAIDGKFVASYGLPADVFSFGVVVWEVITRRVPWDHLDGEVFRQIAASVGCGERPTVADDEMAEVVAEVPGLLDVCRDCWAQDSEKRPTFEEIVVRLKQLCENCENCENREK